MYDEETGTEITFEKIDGKDYAVVTITGVINLESADKIGQFVNDSISIEYDGYVIFDIRKPMTVCTIKRLTRPPS